MQIMWVAVCGITAVFVSLFIKNVKPEFSVYISLSVCILIMILAIGRFSDIVKQFVQIGNRVGITENYLKVLMKMVGITYVSGFAADICKDAGHQAIANQIQIFGKLAVISASLPILTAVLDTVMELF